MSGVGAFSVPANEIPTTADGMWQLAKMFQNHLKTSIDAGQILAIGKIMGHLYQRNFTPINLAEVATSSISNWGCLPFEEYYSKWKFVTMTPLANMIRLPMPTLLAQTINDVLTISLIGAVPVLSASVLEKLRDSTMHHFRQMIAD